VKTDFDDAIGVVPASPIDVDRLIGRGRRRAAVRRLAAVGAGGGVAAVAVGVAVAVAASGGGGAAVADKPSVRPPAATSVPPAATASATPTGKPLPVVTASTPADVARNTENALSPVVRDVVKQHAPGYTLSAGADGPAFKMKYLFYNGNDSYFGSADLHGPTGYGNVAINVGRRSTHWNPTNPCRSAEPDCTDTTEADGTHILRRVIHENGIADNYLIVDRPDGITLFIVAANQGGQLDTDPGHQAVPVLPFDTLVAIAKDPRLTV
jgi:hypothetical protein